MKIYDLIGIGFGPSNISLAISLHERYRDTDTNIDVLFLEKQSRFAWHPNMMLNHTHMQISFLKDLVTPRNPTSSFSFLNYLFSKNRLQDFINLKTFYPSRYEFNDYLKWCAEHFDDQCHYNREVVEITSVTDDTQEDNISYLKVKSSDSQGITYEYLTKSLVIAAGGYGFIPTEFQAIANDKRVFHSSVYLSALKEQNNLQKVAVIGAGQSAAEIFMDLNDNHDVEVDLITRAWAFKPSDNSPFANEIFNPEFTDFVFDNSTGRRTELLKEYRSTNYAAPDLEVIENIYNVFYQQKVTGNKRHSLLRRYEVKRATATDKSIVLTLNNMDINQSIEKSYDAVILATGYERTIHKRLLAPVKQYLKDFSVARNYQVCCSNNFQPMVFLQGCCESTHGLGDTLLSNLSIRTEEICESFEHEVLSKKVAKKSKSIG